MKRWLTQMRKGLVEFAVLLQVSNGETYGYELQKELNRADVFHVSESTLYPVFSRLLKEGALKCRKMKSESGPPRSYYQITPLGLQRLQEMNCAWGEFAQYFRQINQQSSNEEQ